VKFHKGTNNELKVFVKNNGVDDIQKLSVLNVVTNNQLIAEFIDIEHI
jgi:hypothetical protein